MYVGTVKPGVLVFLKVFKVKALCCKQLEHAFSTVGFGYVSVKVMSKFEVFRPFCSVLAVTLSSGLCTLSYPIEQWCVLHVLYSVCYMYCIVCVCVFQNVTILTLS